MSRRNSTRRSLLVGAAAASLLAIYAFSTGNLSDGLLLVGVVVVLVSLSLV